MAYNANILLMGLLILSNTYYSLSLECYSCSVCPKPFNSTLGLVYKESNCTWCAKLIVKGRRTPIRECTPQCNFDYWKSRYYKFSSFCCQTDLCNKNVKTLKIHQILLMIILTFICLFISK
ncbi:hypothetical protein MN116_002812 [Schistosoma mekongi]|uniref:Uncharacterized protein n=1 Tax=Schistosoma mekongi TaxID=38744 RepID=A0AAE1ZH11_SCHME|nr:hypothetical protein MN116_002812 [Schistosoma mekongi]